MVDGACLTAKDSAEIRRLRALGADHGLSVLVFGARTRPPADGSWRCWHIGQESALDKVGLDHALAMSRGLREQLRRARAKGVTVRTEADVATPAPSSTQERDAVLDAWLATRRLPPMQFLLALDDLRAPTHPASTRRWFRVERDGSLCGLASARSDHSTGGHTIEHLVRAPWAPNGATELLVVEMIRSLAMEGSRELSLGLSPLTGVRSRLLRAIARLSRPAFDFAGLSSFKRKFQPRIQRPNWVWYPSGDSRTGTVLEVLRAFAGGSLLRYAARAVSR
ncbi:MAG: phosphatidylglycerol lysyltransferase domain-containing protein [Planctomycetota bacterium]